MTTRKGKPDRRLDYPYGPGSSLTYETFFHSNYTYNASERVLPCVVLDS